MAGWGFRGLVAAGLLLRADPVWAHAAGPRVNPLFVPLSVAAVVVWLSALFGLLGYHANLRRAHAASGAETAYRPRGMTGSLFGLTLLLAVSALGLRAMQHEPPDGDSRLRGSPEEAVDALSIRLSGTPENERVPLLLKFIRDPSPGLRFAAADQLGDFRGPQVAEALESTYAGDSYALARERAMEVLPAVDRARGIRLLVRALRDGDTQIREAAVLQLGGLIRSRGPSEHRIHVPEIVRSLDDPSPIVSASAVRLLAKLTGQRWRAPSRSTKAEQKPVLDACRAWWRAHRSEWPADSVGAAPVQELRRDPAPDFAVRDLYGKTVTREGQRGRVTLVNFWGTWCAPCLSELPDLVAVAETYRDRPVDVVGFAVAERDGPEGLRRWCEEHGVTYRQALATRAVQDAFGRIEAVPVSILIDRELRIRHRWDGPRDAATFRAAIDRLLAE